VSLSVCDKRKKVNAMALSCCLAETTDHPGDAWQRRNAGAKWAEHAAGPMAVAEAQALPSPDFSSQRQSGRRTQTR